MQSLNEYAVARTATTDNAFGQNHNDFLEDWPLPLFKKGFKTHFPSRIFTKRMVMIAQTRER